MMLTFRVKRPWYYTILSSILCFKTILMFQNNGCKVCDVELYPWFGRQGNRKLVLDTKLEESPAHLVPDDDDDDNDDEITNA